jgi:fumarylacetoacetate (FAA) hydrolase family protein
MGLSLGEILPQDWQNGTFLGRVETAEGPSPMLIRGGALFDLSCVAATVAGAIDRAVHKDGSLEPILLLDAAAPELPDGMQLLSPVDLQCIKAAGVTFAVSAVERVIEERARGDQNAAAAIRAKLEDRIGSGIRSVIPGSEEAAVLKAALIAENMWSQYLEVAIGPDAEVFTKAPVLSSVGYGADIGVRSDSSWNNPEPEIAVVTNGRGEVVGATLGNDVNLRDFEGRSALLLGKAKDNNASCALGPFIRMFDDGFGIDDVRNAQVEMSVTGTDQFRLDGQSRMSEISRDPLELVKQSTSQHQYPDGFVLFLGTLFAPTQDRDVAGQGFTHKPEDVVTIRSPRFGTLKNRVVHCNDAAPWTIGIRAFVQNLAARNLIDKL